MITSIIHVLFYTLATVLLAGFVIIIRNAKKIREQNKRPLRHLNSDLQRNLNALDNNKMYQALIN